MKADLRRLVQLIRGQRPCVSIVTVEEGYAMRVVREAALEVRRGLLVWSAIDGLRDGLISPPEGERRGQPGRIDQALGQIGVSHETELVATLDLADHLSEPRALRAWREAVGRLERTGGTLVMVDHSEDLPPVVRSVAEPLELSLPDEEELEEIARGTVVRLKTTANIHVKITKGSFRSIMRNLRGLSRSQAERVVTDACLDDMAFTDEDAELVIGLKRGLLRADGLLEFVDAPASMEEIGGLDNLRAWLSRRERAFSDDAIRFGLQAPRGVLMLGVQGAGKSLCAKAIATAWQRPLLRLDPGSLYDRYVGASEQRLRKALHQAEMMAPIVLWIDEIEKAFASAASRSTDGGLSQRMFGTLLTWMQEHREPVFLVATANDIEALPPELLRKGRFDEIFFVDLPGEVARAQIIGIHLRKRDRDPGKFDIDRLVAATDGYSGAEIEQGVLTALHGAFAAGTDLTTDRLEQAFRSSPPLSVTMAERIAELRAWARDRCVPAG